MKWTNRIESNRIECHAIMCLCAKFNIISLKQAKGHFDMFLYKFISFCKYISCCVAVYGFICEWDYGDVGGFFCVQLSHSLSLFLTFYSFFSQFCPSTLHFNDFFYSYWQTFIDSLSFLAAVADMTDSAAATTTANRHH